jgi:hypothetical protein
MARSDALGLLAIAIGLAALLDAGDAAAYCRTSSCNVGEPHTAQVCTPAAQGDCGLVLFWPRPCMGWSLQKDASKKTSFATTEALVKQAFATWQNAPCPGGGTPRLSVTESEPVDCRVHEYNKERGNANIVLFQDDAWPYEGSSNTLALTTVSYDIDTGEIYDADMELNSAQVNFTTDDANVDFDLLSILTHEAGHFLGLAHSPNADATMFPAYKQHDSSLRDITADDIAGICAIFPPGAPVPSDCDTTPRHGFSTLCGAEQPEPSTGCCSVAPGAPRGASGEGPIAALLGTIGAIALGARLSRWGRKRPQTPRADARRPRLRPRG